VTLDDFRNDEGPRLAGEQKPAAILETLDRFKLKAAGFPAGKYIDGTPAARSLALWSERGHAVGCHGYSHSFYSGKNPAAFVADLDRALPLVAHYPTSLPLFRFPYLAEGRTAAARDAARAALKQRRLSNAHVTIDTSDWYIDGRLLKRLRTDPHAELAPYRRYYIDHLLDRAAFYDRLVRDVLGRTIPHALLLHHNLATALFLGDALQQFQNRGWRLINATQAFAHPVYRREPLIEPAGQSLVWQLAKAHGGFGSRLRSPAEDGKYEKPKMDALGL
jgi:peptidoglycan/xylan/chitin deacetylase (PgdA/CDA1 family)